MSDEKERQDFEDAAQYGTKAAGVRVPGDVLYRIGPIGPQFDEETMQAARAPLNPVAFFEAARAIAGASLFADGLAKAIQASIAQIQEQHGIHAFDARAAIIGAWPAELGPPLFANIIGDAMQAAAAHALQSNAAIAGRAVYNWTLGKDEGCERKQEQPKVQDLGAIG